MQDNKRQENNSGMTFRLPKNILRFVNDFFLGGCEITPAQKKAFAETRKCLFEGIKRKRKNPDSAFFQISRELLDFFDLMESDASSITMYQRKKFRTALNIYKELLIGEWERRSGAKTLDDLDDPVTCVEVAEAVRSRSEAIRGHKKKRPTSYNLARKLRNSGCPIVVDGNKSYCESRDAVHRFPEWKQELKERKKEE